MKFAEAEADDLGGLLAAFAVLVASRGRIHGSPSENEGAEAKKPRASSPERSSIHALAYRAGLREACCQ
jgi:hypothetical protein